MSTRSSAVVPMLEENPLVALRAVPQPLQRVLVAFDGSPGAWAALRAGIAIAKSRNAVLTIAAVVNEPSFWVAMPPFAGPWTRDSLRRESERQLERTLAAARDEVPADVSVATAMLRGRTADALADLADGGGYDLVITGTSHRRRGVAAALLRRCEAAVLAVNPTRT